MSLDIPQLRLLEPSEKSWLFNTKENLNENTIYKLPKIFLNDEGIVNLSKRIGYNIKVGDLVIADVSMPFYKQDKLETPMVVINKYKKDNISEQLLEDSDEAE